MKNLRLVIDTNVFLVSIAKNFRYRWLYDALLNTLYQLLVTTEILLEYEEKFIGNYGVQFSHNRFSEITFNKNIELITPFFHWNLIYNDPDDNKFVDCAIAGTADYLITNDTDFNVLKQVSFPKITVLSLYEFELLFKEQLS